MDFDREALVAELKRDEALKLFVYDDATGLPIRPGTVVRGHPTIGIGRCLDLHGISNDEALYLVNDDIDEVVTQLYSEMPFFHAVDPIRQAVLMNMAFNMGIDHLLGFKTTLTCIQCGDYARAASQMLASVWAKEVGARAKRLAETMRTGIAA